jgi:hypothetical protein
MPFDIQAAKKEGYSDEEIATFLATGANYNLKEALGEGYSHRQVVDFLANKDNPTATDMNMLQPIPGETPKITESLDALDRFDILERLKKMPTELADEWRKETIHRMRSRKYGEIKQDYPSVVRAIENIPENLGEIVNSFSSLILGVPIITYKTIKEILQREAEKAEFYAGGRMPTPEEYKYLSRPYYLEQRGKELGAAIKDSYETFKKDPLLTAGFFAEDNPIDTLLLGLAGYEGIGLGARVVGRAAGIQTLVSTARKPLKIANIAVERQFSKNPLTKMFIQQPFDMVMDRYPRFKDALIKYKGGSLVTAMRNTYEELNFSERVRLHKEVYENIEKLSKQERAMMIPFLEGRLHFRKDLPGDVQGVVDLSKGERVVRVPAEVGKAVKEPISQFGGTPSRWGRGSENVNYQRVRDFQAWYGDFQERIKKGFKLDEKMTADQLENIIYQPIEIETGLSRAVIKAELGDFTPIYVHHYFPWKAKDRLGVHFAETTGKKYTPGMLKKRRGVKGYSEDLTEVLPRMASSYVKWKNTQAFLEEFLGMYGMAVNLRNVKATKEGLMVGKQLYANHKIVAPDGYLRFFKGEVDIWKEIAKRMDDTVDFDESLIDILLNAKLQIGDIKKDYLSATKNIKVYLVPDEAVKKLETMATPVFGTQERQAIVKLAYDLPIQFWKDSVLAITPRWIKNNVMGDIIFNTFEGVGPLSYARAFIRKYIDAIPDEILRASFANVMKYNPKLGKAEETVIGQYVKAMGETVPAKILASVKDIGYGINTSIEQPFVRALYINKARKEAKRLLKTEGIPISEESILTKMLEIKNTPTLNKPIITKVKETLPVFNIMGDFGRKYVRRAMPFVNWYKFMLRYGATLPAKHPFKLVGARGLAALTEKEREEAFRQYFPYMADTIEREGGIPKRFNGLWPIGTDPKTGEGIFFNARGLNPFDTITDILSLRVFSMMSPIIKVGAERALSRDTFTGQKFDTPSPIEITRDGKIRELERITPSFATHVLRQFPQFTLLEQFITPGKQYSTGTIFNPKPKVDPVTGEFKYPINAMDKLLNYVGVDRKTIDVEEWFYKHQERLRQKMSLTHKNLLFEPDALSVKEHLLILEEILLDKEKRKAIERAMTGKKIFKIKEKMEVIKAIKKEQEKKEIKAAESAKRQRAIDRLNEQGEPITEKNIKFIMNELGK